MRQSTCGTCAGVWLTDLEGGWKDWSRYAGGSRRVLRKLKRCWRKHGTHRLDQLRRNVGLGEKLGSIGQTSMPRGCSPGDHHNANVRPRLLHDAREGKAIQPAGRLHVGNDRLHVLCGRLQDLERFVCACRLNDLELSFLAQDIRCEHAQEGFVLHQEHNDREPILSVHIGINLLSIRDASSVERTGALGAEGLPERLQAGRTYTLMLC